VSVSVRVLKECLAVEGELSAKPPGVLKLLSPPLVEAFLKLFAA
jgi:hypothetical protein